LNSENLEAMHVISFSVQHRQLQNAALLNKVMNRGLSLSKGSQSWGLIAKGACIAPRPIAYVYA